MKLELTELKLTKNDIETFEKKLDVALPKHFIDFYLQYNGGLPTHAFYKGYEIAIFLPIKHGKKSNTIESTVERLIIDKSLPQKFIPFASDNGGWFFCLDLGETNKGSVYVLRNGMGDESPEFVTSSFKELISNLSIEDDY